MTTTEIPPPAPTPALAAFLDAEWMGLFQGAEQHHTETAVKSMVVRRLGGLAPEGDASPYSTGVMGPIELEAKLHAHAVLEAKLRARAVPFERDAAGTLVARFADLVVRFSFGADPDASRGEARLDLVDFTGAAGLARTLRAEGRRRPRFSTALDGATMVEVRDGRDGLAALRGILRDAARLAAAEHHRTAASAKWRRPRLLRATVEHAGTMAGACFLGDEFDPPRRLVLTHMPLATLAARHALAHWRPTSSDKDGWSARHAIDTPVTEPSDSATLAAAAALAHGEATMRLAAFLRETGASPGLARDVARVRPIGHAGVRATWDQGATCDQGNAP